MLRVVTTITISNKSLETYTSTTSPYLAALIVASYLGIIPKVPLLPTSSVLYALI